MKISAVSYLNTRPFIYGIEKSGLLTKVELSLDIPSVCASKIINAQADIGLVPVAVLPLLKNYSVVTDYCIGATGAVGSVLLCSQVPIEKVTAVLLDYQSRTSILLAQVLAEKQWKVSPQWQEAQEGYEKKMEGSVAGVIIGDRALELSGNYKYSYDLALEWKKLTSLPFVFACWVAKNTVPNDFINSFNEALRYGVDHREELIHNIPSLTGPRIDIRHYLMNSIDYRFDDSKKKALSLFLEYTAKLRIG